MRTLIAIVLVIVGGLLVLTPIVLSQRQLERTAAFYEQHGDGSTLPEGMRAKPYSRYDWACLAVGATLAFVGIRVSARR